jgi:hypothetical protein
MRLVIWTYKLHAILISALDGDEYTALYPGHFTLPPGERTPEPIV